MITVFEQKCNEGDGASCLLAGWWFSDGVNVPIDDKKAIVFFEKGANLNDFESCCNLGNRYENGKGVEQNYDKAKLYYKKACNAGWRCGCESLEKLLAIAPTFENKILENCAASTIEYTHSDTDIVFVDRIGLLAFSGMRDYGDKKFGISAAYNAPGITATVFVYDMGIENISDKAFSADVVNQFYQADNDAMNFNDSVKILGMDIIDLGDKYILHESHELIDNNTQKHSHILVWGYGKHFIKVRFTYVADNEDQALKALNDLLSYMSQSVSESTLTFDQGLEVFQRDDIRLAYLIWQHLVEKGDVASKYGLAMVFLSSENIDHALYWLNQSADEGYPMAQYDLGQFYCEGKFIEKDLHKGAYWIKKARDSGHEEEYDIWNELSLEQYL